MRSESLSRSLFIRGLQCRKYASAVQRIVGAIIDLMEPFKNRSVYSWQMNAYQVMNRSADPAEIGRIRQALSEYCGFDTLAMVRVLERLRVVGSAATAV